MIKKIYRGMERLAYCIRILKSRGIYFFKYHTMDGFEIEGNVRIEKHVDVFFWLKGRIRIQDNSLISKYSKIGINAVILAGTKIGKNCVVGANAVVKGEFPDYCVIAGVPAVVVKKYDFETESWIKV